jgi:hypothetical protein
MSVTKEQLLMPYPGLRPFEAEDQPLFFGREEEVAAILRKLEDHRFVAVVGSSGSGKSSLVRAGLLPAVREGFLFGTTNWCTLIIKPGHQPYQRLTRALHQAAPNLEEASAVPGGSEALSSEETATLNTLRRADRGLVLALTETIPLPKTHVMLVIDQFEELFAFRRAGIRRDAIAPRDEAAGFVQMLLRSAADSDGGIWVVLTMRSDFFGDCEAFLGLPEHISRCQFIVPRFDRGQMEEAITRPAAVAEGAFKPFTFEEGLVNRIINDAGDRPDQLPLMQHALMRTWKCAVARAGANGLVVMSHADYVKAGGIENALSLHATAAWDEIKDDPKKAHIARRLFLLLCDISPDSQIVRRRPKVNEVQAVTGATVSEIKDVIIGFQRDDRNFLIPPGAQNFTSESHVDISHEALLRQWKLFSDDWQLRERQDVSELRRVTELAALRNQGQEVGFLPPKDLERIARWRDRVSPEWAVRYVTKEEWDNALLFVEESQAEAKRGKVQDRIRMLALPEQQARLKLTGLDDEFWHDLLPRIVEGEVIPVIGPGAVTFGSGNELLYPSLAQRLATELDPPLIFEQPPRDLQEVVDAQRARGRPISRIYKGLYNIVKDPDLCPGATLAALAATEPFQLFLSTTFDPLLPRAVESASPGGKSEERCGAATLRGACPDLPQEITRLEHRFVYQILGRAAPTSDFVVWDDDMLPFLLRLNQQLPLLPRLSEALRRSDLLILGVNFVGWFLRFFVHVIKQKRLSEIAGEELAIFERLDPADRDKVVVYLTYPTGIRILPIDPLEFVAELHERWRKKHPRAVPDPYMMNRAHREEQRARGCIFISYASPDVGIARYVVRQLQEAGCLVWFDKEQIEPGVRWEEEVREVVDERCGLFLSLISEQSAAKLEGYTLFERKLAERRRERFAVDHIFYIPVRIDDGEPLIPQNEPPGTRNIQAIRKPGGHFDSEFISYLRELQRERFGALGHQLRR